MSISTVLFDMDGTLLPMNQDEFVKAYFKTLSGAIAHLGYEPQKLIDTVIKSVYAMKNGDGTRPNCEIFQECFCSVYGNDSLKHMPYFDKYYKEKFDSLRVYTSCNPRSAKLVSELVSKNIDVVLATNPLFPPLAIEKRLSWAGLDYKDFALYTTYDNSSFCKPNPKYYEEILSKLSVSPEECIMIGNDVDDDMIASSLGIKVFLLTDNLINRHEKDISDYPNGGFDELEKYLISQGV